MQPYFTGKVRRESERQSVKLVNVHFTVTEQPETVVFEYNCHPKHWNSEQCNVFSGFKTFSNVHRLILQAMKLLYL